jgi:hypothetical protein
MTRANPLLRPLPTLLAVPVLALALGGCVQRKLTITSEPSNALVELNGKEVGRTPIETDFTWYGNYDVRVRADGHDTLKTESQVTAPWWQWVPFDLVAELMPWQPTDRQSLHYTLTPSQPVDTPSELLIDRATEMQAKLTAPAAK